MIDDLALQRPITRHLMDELREAWSDTRVVMLNGPRQAGKSTMLRMLHEETGGALRSFDDSDQLAVARDDPRRYLQELPRPGFIDEVQRAGDPLIRAIKVAVDADPRPGHFILSGSTRFLTIPTISESLAGRVAILDLLPLSTAERAGITKDLLGSMLDDPEYLLRTETAPVTRHEYLQVACTGGFPEAITRSPGRSRNRWFSNYLRTITQRDVLELKRISDVDRIARLARYLGAITAQELTIAEVARAVDVDVDTAKSDLTLLETMYIFHRLPAWSRNLTARVKRKPKVHLIDSGLAAWIRNQSPQALARPTESGAGALFETFVVNELLKLRALSEVEFEPFHFRDRDQREIDLILESGDGRVIGVEVKTATSVNKADFKHLETARDKLGEQFARGIVIYTGPHALPFGDRLVAIPASLLWGGGPVSDLR